MSSSKQVKHFSNPSKFTVFGYVRHVEKDISSGNIPNAISCLCLLFYAFAEYFDKIPNSINLSQDGSTISKERYSTWNNTTYCKNWISSSINQIATWIFEINSFGESRGNYNDPDPYNYIYFALVSKDNRVNKNLYSVDDRPLYAFSNNLELKYRDQCCQKGVKQQFKPGDKVTIIYNTKDRILNVSVNGNKSTCCYSKIWKRPSIKYKLAITLFSPQASVSLIDFERHYRL